jgi:CII-binding regulator of phage lambda lysogenization HflD
METIKEVMSRHVDLHSDPTKKQFQLTMDGLLRLITELERPQNRELMRFVVAWQKLEKELDKLQRKIQERMADEPVNKVNQFLQQLKNKTVITGVHI